MDLKAHLLRHMAWSHATFGPGRRTDGIIDHIKKELVEVAEADGLAAEWLDVVILAFDGLTRHLSFDPDGKRYSYPEKIVEWACDMIAEKQGINEGRTWPDWRTAPADKAIEHVKV